jgi:hypothetical protein
MIRAGAMNRLPGEKPLPFNCLKCGKPLLIHAFRVDKDVTGATESVHVYLCHEHGFFTFKESKGLVEGL